MLCAINCGASSVWVNWEHWVFPMFLLTLSLCFCRSSVLIFGNPVIKPLDTGATGAFPASCVLKQPWRDGRAAGGRRNSGEGRGWVFGRTPGITSTGLSCGVGSGEEGEHQRKRRDKWCKITENIESGEKDFFFFFFSPENAFSWIEDQK